MAAAKTDGKKKVIKTIAKKKAKKGAAAAEKAPAAPVPKEEKKEGKTAAAPAPAAAAAAPPPASTPAKGKGKPKGKGKAKVEEAKANAEAKAQAKAQSRKTKARRLEEAQARVDAEEDDEGSAAAAASDQPRGVIYIGHIPQGFYEPQMRKYFSQFGKVTRVRHSRSKKNAASKGYGWIEFAEEAVAKIAQQTMDGYLMFGKKLKCEMVPPDKVHPSLFKNSNKRMVNFTNKRRTKAREAYNNRPTTEVDGETIPRMTLRQAARRSKSQKRLSSVLKGMEVKYDLEAAKHDASDAGDFISFSAGAPPARGKSPSSPKAKAKKSAASSSSGPAASKKKRKA
mmetsp:Transcript_137765/g.343857  ORF Transcript_137765/g.343857 Transcript_137765/m.343857 type:complete len:340 (-) Transcript_137765:57-1076(-)|eukprot:CAMPEP_0115211404 /NCGR_PEP_ID=MMETSP0270-20121206/22747_1 /TAXON_ID=71861 /ORGANISM="Scrippsiella trochoidea, Strain CCMP3099" /LENGTH=339 /DNA_ID=CAMNT_0002625093 /DNA_START=81 /DNA_END=1100 /DNA_ORIENTATION=+